MVMLGWNWRKLCFCVTILLAPAYKCVPFSGLLQTKKVTRYQVTFVF